MPGGSARSVSLRSGSTRRLRIVQHLPREHPARQRQRAVSAGIVNGAGVIAAAAEKKCAAAVFHLCERAVGRDRDPSSYNRQGLDP